MSKKPATPVREEEPQLFDYVLIVGLRKEGNGGIPKPYVDYRFPPAPGAKDTLADAIVQFCFPEAEQWSDTSRLKKHESETFSFVLTEADGSRKFGYCRRLIAKDQKGNLVPECYCIISFLPELGLFMKLLNIVEELRTKKSSSAVFSFLKTTLAKKFPSPGEKLVIRTFEGDTHELTRADNDYLLDMVSFKTLFKLKISQILDIFTAVLLESRIILCSQKVSTLSECVFALNALLYPFTWQHVYIPILPKSLMSYCAAPMPFMVGVLGANLNELNSYPMEEVVLIDVDTGKYLCETPPTCNSEKYLPSFGASLKSTLKMHLKNQNQRANDLGIAQLFLQFFYKVFENHEAFIRGHVFNREEFYASRTKDVQKFLDIFSGSQMYEMFVRDIESRSKSGTLSSFPISKEKFLDLNVKTLVTIDQEKTKKQCGTCGKDVINDGFEYKDNVVCEQCYNDRKVKKREKYKSMAVSMPNLKTVKDDKGIKGAAKSFISFFKKGDQDAAIQGGETVTQQPDSPSTPREVGSSSPNPRKLDLTALNGQRDSNKIQASGTTSPRGSIVAAHVANFQTPRPYESQSQANNSANTTTSSTTAASPPQNKPPLPTAAKPTRPVSSSTPAKPLPPTPGSKDVSRVSAPGNRNSTGSPVGTRLAAEVKQQLDSTGKSDSGSKSSPNLTRNVQSTGKSSPRSSLSTKPVNYCSSCGGKVEGPTCTTCGKPVPAEKPQDICEGCKKILQSDDIVANILGKMWHKGCLKCASCGKQFTDSFALKDTKPYHPECLKPKCAQCQQPISNRALTVDGKSYHDSCLVCKSCSKSLIDGYVQKASDLYCPSCSNSR